MPLTKRFSFRISIGRNSVGTGNPGSVELAINEDTHVKSNSIDCNSENIYTEIQASEL